jgi:hypothetical protein
MIQRLRENHSGQKQPKAHSIVIEDQNKIIDKWKK